MLVRFADDADAAASAAAAAASDDDDGQKYRGDLTPLLLNQEGLIAHIGVWSALVIHLSGGDVN
jgi:hypothetical protein